MKHDRKHFGTTFAQKYLVLSESTNLKFCKFADTFFKIWG